jgi:hypothetical protein
MPLPAPVTSAVLSLVWVFMRFIPFLDASDGQAAIHETAREPAHEETASEPVRGPAFAAQKPVWVARTVNRPLL